MRSLCMFVRNPFRHDSRVLREAAGLAGDGWAVRVVATLDPGCEPEETVAGFRVVRVPQDPLAARLVRRLLARARGSSTEIGAVVSTEQLNPSYGRLRAAALRPLLRVHLGLSWLTFARRALAQARSEPAAVWVAHDLDTLPIAAIARGRLGGRLVYDSHELFLEHEGALRRTRVTKELLARVERTLIRRANLVVTVNESISQELARRYAIRPPAVIRNLPEAPGPAPVGDLRERLGAPATAPIALYVGGLAPERGLEHLIEAVSLLDGVALAIVGPGEVGYRSRLTELARTLGAGDRIRLLAPVPAGQVIGLAATADVGAITFRNTSLNNYLCLPNKLFEYLAGGLPVIASNFPELQRIVCGWGVGDTCDPEDPHDIARALSAVLDPSRQAELRASARRAATELTWEQERAKWVGLIAAMSELRAEPGTRPRSAGSSQH